ncbi:helix-turn-helix domain-containing protein [Oceanobacillus jeddahense]|uniref:helix-turn-helix domain-containing protein n=1 Tax=Oceanobacillus jeddahense TaxID=1462527 RepID=UPI0005958739|nr:helix-turn-helix domain-containing protein [Oceanobacillus jeddahense]
MNQYQSTFPHLINELLPFSVIVSASKGNVEAINVVLKHYEPYMNKLSLRLVYNEFGTSHMVVDDYTRRRLETKLITAILGFKLT